MMTVTQVGPTLVALTAEIRDRLATAQAVNAEVFHETLVDTEPVRTGRMRAATVTVAVDRFTYQEQINVDYAAFVNSGTRYQAPQFFVERTLAATEPGALAACWAALEGLPGWQG